jgi:hypothetical protein
LVLKVLQDNLDLLVNLDHLVLKDSPVLKDPLELQELLDRVVQLGLREIAELLDLQDRQELLVVLAQ